MKFLKAILVCWSLVFAVSCADRAPQNIVTTPSIIPQPSKMQVQDGYFTLDATTKISAPDVFDKASMHLLQLLQNGAAFGELSATESNSHIRFVLNKNIPKEGYTLKVDAGGVEIGASDGVGAFYGVQSLKQLMPVALLRTNSVGIGTIGVPFVMIEDAPKFSYRGMHLDVGRHFFPKEFIKEYIANLSMLKMNYFHWHLTEDQGWRIEILQYPNLTKHAAYREETLIGHYNDSPQQFDGVRYGGFYTQEDIKEIVAFAQEHKVTIIPEIEMPGHAQAAISAYPELGCTREQIPVATKWGVFEDIYCPKPETFTFLKNVLAEVMELFPGEYIHIGGDEAPKEHWKSCAHCQKLIKELGLKDEHGLQSHFIKEIESFVNSKGKKIIGWDEILEGGLAPNATVMSWRGTQGAIDAAKEGHDVILTPTSHAYFDYYQATHTDEPLAIGGFLPLKKVFGFNPIPEGLTEEESKFVLGAQGNIWTEYMPTTDQVEYMAFPRILAMSEVVWGGAQEDVENAYPKFLSKVENILPRLAALDINYANHLFDIKGQVIKNTDGIFYSLDTPIKGKEIVYKTNATKLEPLGEDGEQQYNEPIHITKNTIIQAEVVLDENRRGKPFEEHIKFHKGIVADIGIDRSPHPSYSAGGIQALNNGVSGSDTRFGDKEWLGFWGDDIEITLIFHEPTTISNVSTRFYDANGQWVYSPKEAHLTCYYQNNLIKEYTTKPESIGVTPTTSVTFHGLETQEVSRIVLKIPNYGVIPAGLQGAGNKAWTFIDEIVIE